MKNFGKYFLLVLAFLSIGAGSTYGNNLPEIKEEQPLSSEDLKATNAVLWIYRENPFQEISELSENLFFGTVSVIPEDLNNSAVKAATSFVQDFQLDLRRLISQQIFPKHFFL